MIRLVPEENTDSRMTISVRVDCKTVRYKHADFVDKQRESRLCPLDSTKHPLCFLSELSQNSTLIHEVQMNRILFGMKQSLETLL